MSTTKTQQEAIPRYMQDAWAELAAIAGESLGDFMWTNLRAEAARIADTNQSRDIARRVDAVIKKAEDAPDEPEARAVVLPVECYEHLERKAQQNGDTVDNLLESIVRRHVRGGGVIEYFENDELFKRAEQAAQAVGVEIDTYINVAISERLAQEIGKPVTAKVSFTCDLDPATASGLILTAYGQGRTVGDMLHELVKGAEGETATPGATEAAAQN